MMLNAGIGLVIVGIILGALAYLQHQVGIFHVLHLAAYLGILALVALVAGVALFALAARKA